MKFIVHKFSDKNATKISPTKNSAILIANNWDDYSYKTLFNLEIYDGKGERHEIGNLKIGYVGQSRGWTEDKLPDFFESLDEKFFSLGLSDEFYQKIQDLPSDLKRNILISLRNVVNNEDILNVALEEEVMKYSLLRSVSLSSINGQFSRILHGEALLTDYHFKYSIPQGTRVAGLELEFHVAHDQNPPTNVHVLIGRNGVGKTHLLNNMVKALIQHDVSDNNVGTFSISSNRVFSHFTAVNPQELFAGVVSVAFSAFDPFEPYPEQKDKTKHLRYTYVGLKRSTNHGGDKGTPMSPAMITNEFVKSLLNSFKLGRKQRWIDAIKNLETDILFREISLSELVVDLEEEDVAARARQIFNKLSSGHAIVLLTITKLVENVEEKTLVLLDEPEAHLHPPLLSAFIRSLSELLNHRNGVAIVATHSPVILQEVPRSCVWKLWRSGLEAKPERPQIETFGENVGVLTREVFLLEGTESGYHQLLKAELKNENSYEKILKKFNNQLGAEARGILRGLLLTENDRGE